MLGENACILANFEPRVLRDSIRSRVLINTMKLRPTLILIASAFLLGGCARTPASPLPQSPSEKTPTARDAPHAPTTTSLQATPTLPVPQKIISKKFLALGDSYTIGQGVSAADRWPTQLTQELRTQAIAIDDPTIIARTGWTTADLDYALQNTAPQEPFDLVTLMIGVNDQFQGRPSETYQRVFTKVLQEAIKLAGNTPAHVVVISIPDWSATPFGRNEDQTTIAEEIDRFNDIARAETKKQRAVFVDITQKTRAVGMDGALFAADGLHPGKKIHALWTAAIKPSAKKILLSERMNTP